MTCRNCHTETKDGAPLCGECLREIDAPKNKTRRIDEINCVFLLTRARTGR